MAYNKTDWKDRVVETPLTFTLQNNPDGTVTLIPAEGQIIEAGTSINAVNMNNLEKQYDEAVNWVKKTGIGPGAANELAPYTDLNSVTVGGAYRLAAGHSNAPTTAGYGQLFVIKGNDAADTLTQLFFPFNDSKAWFRSASGIGSNPLWQNWREVRTDGPVIWYDIPLWNGAQPAPGRNPKYCLEGKRVTLEGELSFPYGSGYGLGGLPVGYRPAQLKLFTVSVNTSVPNQTCTLYVATDGSIVVHSRPDTTSAISLNGISFYID